MKMGWGGGGGGVDRWKGGRRCMGRIWTKWQVDCLPHYKSDKNELEFN